MPLQPIPPRLHIYFYGYGECHGGGHFVVDDGLDGFQFGEEYVENEFVVDLQQHPGGEIFSHHSPMHGNHRHFHQIGGGYDKNCDGQYFPPIPATEPAI